MDLLIALSERFGVADSLPVFGFLPHCNGSGEVAFALEDAAGELLLIGTTVALVFLRPGDQASADGSDGASRSPFFSKASE